MKTGLNKFYAFIRRDFLTMMTYRLAFVMRIVALLFSLGAFFYMAKMMDPNTAGLDGIPPFDYVLVGLIFLGYFSTALLAFSAKIRSEQLLGTLEAMLVTPTPTALVIFFSASWEFAFGAVRLVAILLVATFIFGVQLQIESPLALLLGVVLTLFSSIGLGILSASFILYFKRGDPINFLLSGVTTFFGSVFFPVEQLPEWIRGFANFVPMAWSLRVVRGSLLKGMTLEELSTELGVLAMLTMVLLPLGLIVSRFAIRKAKKEGTLVQY